jgi:hypothetical protein
LRCDDQRTVRQERTDREERAAPLEGLADERPAGERDVRVLPAKDEANFSLAEVTLCNPRERVVWRVAERRRVDVGREPAEASENARVERAAEGLRRWRRYIRSVSQSVVRLGAAGLRTRWPPRHMPVVAIRPVQFGSETRWSIASVASSS